jgi:hypothetical protein
MFVAANLRFAVTALNRQTGGSPPQTCGSAAFGFIPSLTLLDRANQMGTVSRDICSAAA